MSSSSPLVVVFSRIPGIIAAVQGKLGQINLHTVDIPPAGCQLSDESLSTLHKAEILLADPGPIASSRLAQDLPNLKWFQSTWAGVDSIIGSLDGEKPLPAYQFTRCAGCFGQLLGEYVLGHIIATERKFSALRDDQQQKLWRQEMYQDIRPLSTLTIGVMGIGDIGREIARMAKAMGMTVEGLVRKSPVQENSCPSVDKYRTVEELPVLLENCDYICNVLPSTRQTAGLLNGEVLSHCQNKKPVFINIGRGDVIDEEVLIKALDEEWLSHAVLDVFKKEPLSEDSALWSHPNVTVTPHVSGVSLPQPIADMFEVNYEKYIKHETLLYPVNWQAGY